MLRPVVSALRGPATLLGFAVLAAGMVAALATVGSLIVARVAGRAPILTAAALAGVLVLVGVAVMRVYRRRARGRQWAPLRQAMIRDADTLPDTYLAQIHTRPEPATGGLVIATDLRNGGRGPLWLGGHTLPPGTVVCFTSTATGPELRMWMTGQLWRACCNHAARAGRRAAYAERRTQRRAERQIRRAADHVVSIAEDILREHAGR